MTDTPYGATPQEWSHFSKQLGLTADLLPVVSNPNAKISERSAMKQLGKTPSKYYSGRTAGGIKDWTSKQSTEADIASWSKEPDYGICLQTRHVRAIDIDVDDKELARTIAEDIQGYLNFIGLPIRYRENSGKCLLVFKMEGELSKRVARLGDDGIIELLGNGQQFIAVGQHPSGARYTWDAVSEEGDLLELPENIPTLTIEEVDKLWQHLVDTYAVESSTATTPTKAKVLNAAIENDTDAQYLLANDWVKQVERDGRIHITCPFEEEHTSESAISATTYFPANTGGYAQGHYQCLHAHCERRTDDEFRAAIGIPVHDPFDDFDDVSSEAEETSSETPEKVKRFSVVPVGEFAEGAPPEWIVKHVIPQAELVVVYGESGSGKSFFITDLACSVARGEDWRGKRVKQGRVVYVAAEGAGGMRNRMRAYSIQHSVDLSSLGVGVIADAPNFMQVQDVKDVIQSIRAFGKTSLVVVDTFAQVMAGSNENAGEDVGKALSHCRQIHKHTGATVVLVHHAGKDTSKGARGWSGLRAAADAEIEVVRCDDDRSATVTKMKDGADGAEFAFKLETVTLAKDLDDEDITSCIVQHVEGGAVKARSMKGTKASTEARILHVFEDLISLGEDRVDYAMLLDKVKDGMVSGQKSVASVLQTLVDKGTLQLERGFVRRGSADYVGD